MDASPRPTDSPARPSGAARPAAGAGAAGGNGADLFAGALAVSLDVGGVLVLPDHEKLASALTAAGVSYDRRRFTAGHYAAMAEVDRCLSVPEEFGDYRRGFLHAVGTPDDQLDLGAAALARALVSGVWHQPIPGAVGAARRLRAAGLRLAVTSNADGSVEALLRNHGLAQVGPGDGVEVEAVTDSGVLGVAKPDPAMFLATASALGLPPDRVCHVGDGGYYDAEGARAVGMVGVHVDPLDLCPDDRHLHVASLAALADRIAAPAPAAG